MPSKNVVPYREGYKSETRFPKKGVSLLTPLHGAAPRCRVDYNPRHNDGPWTTVQIMHIDDDDKIEHFTCAMPRYYAVPLILINKRLSYYEAQCSPDGTPLPPAPGNGSAGPTGRKQELKEYTYLWRLRSRFLQAVFDMNHERQLDEAWRCDKIHGYVHRAYKRYGHDAPQRHVYWKDEIEAGRMPYATPDIADMDWGAYVAEEMTASTRLNGFLWNRISQGYGCLVRDKPPLASWQAWRRGGTSRDLSASLYRTPPPQPSPSPSSSPASPGRGHCPISEERDGRVAVKKEQGQDYVGCCPEADEASTTVQANAAAALLCSATICDGNNVDYVAATFDGSHEWALPFPTVDLSRGASQAAANTGGTGDLSRRRRISLTLDLPNHIAVADLLCTVTRAEDVGNNHKMTLRVGYTSDVS